MQIKLTWFNECLHSNTHPVNVRLLTSVFDFQKANCASSKITFTPQSEHVCTLKHAKTSKTTNFKAIKIQPIFQGKIIKFNLTRNFSSYNYEKYQNPVTEITTRCKSKILAKNRWNLNPKYPRRHYSKPEVFVRDFKCSAQGFTSLPTMYLHQRRHLNPCCLPKHAFLRSQHQVTG